MYREKSRDSESKGEGKRQRVGGRPRHTTLVGLGQTEHRDYRAGKDRKSNREQGEMESRSKGKDKQSEAWNRGAKITGKEE